MGSKTDEMASNGVPRAALDLLESTDESSVGKISGIRNATIGLPCDIHDVLVVYCKEKRELGEVGVPAEIRETIKTLEREAQTADISAEDVLAEAEITSFEGVIAEAHEITQSDLQVEDKKRRSKQLVLQSQERGINITQQQLATAIKMWKSDRDAGVGDVLEELDTNERSTSDQAQHGDSDQPIQPGTEAGTETNESGEQSSSTAPSNETPRDSSDQIPADKSQSSTESTSSGKNSVQQGHGETESSGDSTQSTDHTDQAETPERESKPTGSHPQDASEGEEKESELPEGEEPETGGRVPGGGEVETEDGISKEAEPETGDGKADTGSQPSSTEQEQGQPRASEGEATPTIIDDKESILDSPGEEDGGSVDLSSFANVGRDNRRENSSTESDGQSRETTKGVGEEASARESREELGEEENEGQSGPDTSSDRDPNSGVEVSADSDSHPEGQQESLITGSETSTESTSGSVQADATADGQETGDNSGEETGQRAPQAGESTKGSAKGAKAEDGSSPTGTEPIANPQEDVADAQQEGQESADDSREDHSGDEQRESQDSVETSDQDKQSEGDERDIISDLESMSLSVDDGDEEAPSEAVPGDSITDNQNGAEQYGGEKKGETDSRPTQELNGGSHLGDTNREEHEGPSNLSQKTEEMDSGESDPSPEKTREADTKTGEAEQLGGALRGESGEGFETREEQETGEKEETPSSGKKPGQKPPETSNQVNGSAAGMVTGETLGSQHKTDQGASPDESALFPDSGRTQELVDVEYVFGDDDPLMPAEADVEAGGVVKNSQGTYWRFLKVEPVEWSVKSLNEKAEVSRQFQKRVLAPLDYDIKMVYLPTELEVGGHISHLRRRASDPGEREPGSNQSGSPEIVNIAREYYIGWFSDFVEVNDMTSREFYICIPISDERVNQLAREQSFLYQLQDYPIVGRLASQFVEEEDRTDKELLTELETRTKRVKSACRSNGLSPTVIRHRNHALRVAHAFIHRGGTSDEAFSGAGGYVPQEEIEAGNVQAVTGGPAPIEDDEQ